MVSRTALAGERGRDTESVGKPTRRSAGTLRRPCRSPSSRSTSTPCCTSPSGLTVRWQTIALAAVVAVCLAMAGVLARRCVASRGRPPVHRDRGRPGSGGRRTDRVCAARPGRVSRRADVAARPDGRRSRARPGGRRWSADRVRGGGPARSAGGRWAHLLATPAARRDRGRQADDGPRRERSGPGHRGTWATAYLGAGPWVGLAPDLSSHPAQVYEAVGTLVVAVIVVLATAAGAFRALDGRLLLIAIAGWALVRAVVSTTWRDPVVAGPLPVGGLVALGVAIGGIVATVLVPTWRPRRVRDGASTAAPVWPDPETRPPF